MTHNTLRALAIGFTLAGTACAGVQQTPVVAAREAVAASAAAYSTAWIAFHAYAQLPNCKVAQPPCREPQIVVDVGQKLVIARDAVDRARDVVNLIPDKAQATPAQQAVIDEAQRAAGAAVSAAQGAGK